MLGSALSGLGDLERGLTRALHKTASPAILGLMLHRTARVHVTWWQATRARTYWRAWAAR